MRTRFIVSYGGWNRDFNLTTGIDLTPDGQVTSYCLSPLAHAIQPPVSCALLLSKKLRVNSLSIIPNPHSKLPFVIVDFHFNPSGLCVPECIAHRLRCNPVDLISKDRI